MFKPVRKKINEIDRAAAEALLQSNRRGILAMNGDNGYPYAIPINYFYDCDKKKIYFHGAKAGHKVDALKSSDKVCFTVYGDEHIDESEPWGPICAKCSSIWAMPFIRGQSRIYRSIKRICYEILS